MFGGPLPYPKMPQRKARKRGEPDILMPHSHFPGEYAHRAREPNTDYDTKLLHYKQRLEEFRNKNEGGATKSENACLTNILHQNYAEKRRFQAKIQLRLQEKLHAYEADVERRRDKLRELLYAEEQELIRETVQRHQNADANKIEDRRKQCEMVRAQKEAERLELVRQKRFQQYAARSQELRPFVAKQRLHESKNCQLQQIRENEFRREAERETEKLWCEVARKRDEATLERQMQEALHRHEEHNKDMAILDMQVLAKKMMEEERKAIERSNREEMQRTMERIAKEEEEEENKRREKAKETAADVRAQLELQQRFQAQRKKEEYALDQAFKELNDLAVAKEAAQMDDRAEQFKRETALYREHLAQLKKMREEDDERLNQLLMDVRREDQKKADDRTCKVQAEKEKLKRDVMDGRAKQLEENRLRAEKNLQNQRNENEALRKCMEQNNALDAEAKRLEIAAAHQYRQDLTKQIQYNNILREREMRDLEERLRKGIEQEEQFERDVQSFFDTKNISMLHHKHPFRVVLEQYDCHCPEDRKDHKM